MALLGLEGALKHYYYYYYYVHQQGRNMHTRYTIKLTWYGSEKKGCTPLVVQHHCHWLSKPDIYVGHSCLRYLVHGRYQFVPLQGPSKGRDLHSSSNGTKHERALSVCAKGANKHTNCSTTHTNYTPAGQPGLRACSGLRCAPTRTRQQHTQLHTRWPAWAEGLLWPKMCSNEDTPSTHTTTHPLASLG
jgi:hypothetical protein